MRDLAVFPPVLEADYERLGDLGAGGMGAVFKARDRATGGLVAIKVSAATADPTRRVRFLREAEALRRVRHPRVLRLRDFGAWAEGQYLVLDFLDGRSLEGFTGLQEPLAVLLDVAEGLEAVHAAGLVHRDVKPANMMLTRDGRGTLIDLGLALDSTQTALTKEGAVVGSAAFLAPEVIRGERATPAADWYAWGVSLYQLQEGGLPFATADLLRAASGVAMPPPAFHRLDPRGVQARLIRALTDPDPAARPASLPRIRALIAAAELDSTKPRAAGDPREVTTAMVSVAPDEVTRVAAPRSPAGWSRVALAAAALVLVGGTAAYRRAAAPAPAPPLDDAGRLYLQAMALVRGDQGAVVRSQAAELFRQAAELGHGESALNLGISYHSGQGVPRDYARAARWFARGADAGNARAQARLGRLYEIGRGVPRDPARAADLYRRGAAGGNALAMGNLGVLYYNGAGVPQDYAEAVRWLSKASDAGDAAATRNLGQCYERGRGVAVDPARAAALYRRAAGLGDREAARRAARIAGGAGAG